MGLLVLLLALPVSRPAVGVERAVVELTDGSRIEGEVLKKDSETVHLSVGDQVVTLSRKQIEVLREAGWQGERVAEVRAHALYKSGRGVVKAVSAHSDELGAGVVTVKTPAGMGTGWFCHPDGYVLTNAHVIADERSVDVTAFKRDGERFEKKVLSEVKIVAVNDDIDLALLKIEEEIDLEVPQLYLGDSAAVKEGDEVFTIGNPMGLERSTSKGVVSKVNRSFGGRLYIQSTTPISPGNSGGPLFNERGEVIGVTNMGYIMLDGLGFAIPSRYVKEFLNNVEAFAYDPDNPNSGIKYMEAPVTATDDSIHFARDDFIKAGHGITCLTLADVNGDGVDEAVFANNNKAEIGIVRRRRPGEKEQRTEDVEDINRIPPSERFKLETHPVQDKIWSLVVSDLDGDGRRDLLIYGDIHGLAVLHQQEDGDFQPAAKVADVELAERDDALRVADVDGDGGKEIVALGDAELHVIEPAGGRRSYPLNADFRDDITEFRLADANEDGRTDVVFFAGDKHYATRVLRQNEDDDFVDEQLLSSHLAGPVEPYRRGGGERRFLTLDKGRNRVRELVLGTAERPPRQGRLSLAPHALALNPEPGTAEAFELIDVNGDRSPDIVTASKSGNEFLVFLRREGGFELRRSAAPRGLLGLQVYRPEPGSTVAFSYSEEDKIFGVSTISAAGRASFPRPINTDGTVQLLKLVELAEGTPTLLWVEKADRTYSLHSTPVAPLAQQVLQGGGGSIDVESAPVLLGPDEANLESALPGKPRDLALGDFNGDGTRDLVVYWSYSGRESLYLGLGRGRFKAIVADREFLKEQDGQPLQIADVDGDGREDVLLVQPGFVRVLRVDEKDKLYVDRQYNWRFQQVSRLVPYGEEDPPRFVALSGDSAKVVELDHEAGRFKLIANADLSGLSTGRMQVEDMDGDGRPDLLMLAGNALQVLYAKGEGATVRDRMIFDAPLEYFSYWNLRPADLDGDGADEVMLFDSKKAMFEIHRPSEDGRLKPILRHRLFEKTISQRGETDSHQLPRELAVGDVDANGMADLVFVLQDRVAIYSQEAVQKATAEPAAERAGVAAGTSGREGD
ncbi:MAG: FG-GAP-like repeat-containing protein [Planctomycetota bacterium]